MVSVIIPLPPGTTLLPATERALQQLERDQASDSLEILLAYGRNPSQQRNAALRQAQGEIVYFLDGDAVPNPHLFQVILPCYHDLTVAGVGGPVVTPDTDGFLQQCFGRVLSSLFGAFHSRARYASLGQARPTGEDELILCNLSLRKSVLEQEGAFVEKLYPNEENELIHRLQQRGYTFLYHPQAVVYRSQPRDLVSYFTMIFRYGRGRMEQMFVKLSPAHLLRLIPLAGLVVFLGSVVWAPFLAKLLLILYSSCDVCASGWEAIRRRSRGSFPVFLILFPLTHVAYACGLAWGIVRNILPRRHPLVAVRIERLAEMHP